MHRIVVLICAITLPWAFTYSLRYTSTVQTTYGPVQGEEVSSDGVKFKAFRGIPYAAPPVGELRFRAPEPPEKWTTVRDATRFGSICQQPVTSILLRSLNFRAVLKYVMNLPNVIRIMFRYFMPSEDCLTLNVYTTQLRGNSSKPVMVYIHGGGFTLGDSTDIVYGPEFLIDKDIVIVTMNYRLGVLGFLATNTSDAPGNWGLKDQVAALRWVQDNIAQFGGDPKQVTIYGASSGAASVQFHMMSPLSKGLFHKAISNSGSAVCSWAMDRHPDLTSKHFAEVTGASQVEIEDPAKRVQYLRKLSPHELIRGMTIIMDEDPVGYGINLVIPFAPVVEPGDTHGAFMTENPEKQFAEGRFDRVPVMTGVNSLEGGILFMGFSKLKSPNELKKFDIDVCKILPEELRKAIEARDDCSKVNKEIAEVYFGGKSTRSSPLNFTYLLGDFVLVYPTMYSHAVHARYSTKDNPAYFYYFSYDGEWNLFKEVFNIDLPGVLHGGDINYVFKQTLMKLPTLDPSSPGYHTKERMVGFISNFVKYGLNLNKLIEAWTKLLTNSEKETFYTNEMQNTYYITYDSYGTWKAYIIRNNNKNTCDYIVH